MAAARFVLATVLLGVWAARRGSLRLPALSDLPIVLAMGATAVAGYNVLFLYGLELAPATDGAIIVPGFAPVFAVLVGWVALGEGSRRALLGLVVALGGLVAVVDPSGTVDSDRVAGAAIFMAGRCAGGSTRTSGSRRPRVSVPVTATFYATAAGALMLIPFSLAERGWRDLVTQERTPGCRSAISPCSGPCSRSCSSTRGFAASGPRRPPRLPC